MRCEPLVALRARCRVYSGGDGRRNRYESVRAWRRLHLVAASLLIEWLGRKVDAVRPADRSRLWIDAHLREVGGTAKRLQHASPLASAEIDVAHGPVLECEAKAVIADDLDRGDVQQLLHEPDAREAA